MKTNLNKTTSNALSDLTTMWDAFDAARAKTRGDVRATKPPGGITIRDYAERYSVPRRAAGEYLAGMVARGEVTCVRVMLPSASAAMVPTNVYVPVSK